MNHFYEFIPGWFDFENLYHDMIEKFPSGSNFLEIGCWKGKSTAFMAVDIINSNKMIHLTCVDSWLGDNDCGQENLFNEFLSNMAPVSHKINVLRNFSVQAARNFPDNFFDFIFIDAAHDYMSVKQDIITWLPKLKPEGIIAGHDYFVESVRHAVNEMAFVYKKNVSQKYRNCWMFS
jgi:predicted O-methyltransferase YrrM